MEDWLSTVPRKPSTQPGPLWWWRCLNRPLESGDIVTDLVNMWFIASAILIISVVLWACGRIGESKSSQPQMIFGIKTRTTTRTPEHW
ncbi:hypothetical protein [Luteococcus sediminum]